MGLLVSVIACNDYTPPSPRPTPDSIAIHSGDEQGADVGQQLPQPLEVIVRSTTGEPMAGVEVFWSAGLGGDVSPTKSITGANGVAQAVRTLGATLGSYTTVALTPHLLNEPVVFTSYGRIDGGYRLGNRTIGPLTDTTLGTNDQPLVVMVVNEKDEPVPGVNVTWTALNGGTLSATSVPTDAGGESIVTFTYGPTARSYSVEAAKDGLIGSPIAFQLIATAGNAVAIVKTNGDNLSVPAGAQVIYTVTAQDARGNPANGVRIEWAVASGGGSIAPAANFTGGNGTATATRTLGPTAGAQTATATAPDLPGAPSVTFTTNAGVLVRRP
jgi:adhesin/invasin